MRQHLVIYCPEESSFKYLDPIHNKIDSIRFSAEGIDNDIPLFSTLLPDHQKLQVFMTNNGY